MEQIKFLDFDLLIERVGDRYRARVLHSPAGQASAEFVLPFTDEAVENLMLRVGRVRRGVRRLESPEMQAAKQFGGKLFDAVFSSDVRGALRSSIETANREDAGLRVRLRLADAPDLVDLPWEFLYNSTLNRFLALSNRTPLVRYIDLPETPRPLKIAPPLRVLVMISSPSDYEALDVEREWQKLNDAVRDLSASNMVQLERLDVATLGALRRKLRQAEYHVLHFIGHAGFDAQAQDGVLLLEDEQKRGRKTSGQYLAQVLTDHKSLRLVVLNACEGARTARNDPFAGVAQSLVQQGISAVIAMQFEVTDEASITFAHEFYAAVADGYPVDAALGEARGAIFSDVNDLEWGTPVLYLRAPDGMIFAPLSEQERAERKQTRPKNEQNLGDTKRTTVSSPPSTMLPGHLPERAIAKSKLRANDVPTNHDTAGSLLPQGISSRLALPIAGVVVLLLLLCGGGVYVLGVFNTSTPTPTTVAVISPTMAATELSNTAPKAATITSTVRSSPSRTPTPEPTNGPTRTPVVLIQTATLPSTATPTLTKTPTSLPQAGTVENRGVDNAPMVFVPAGEFLMGSVRNDANFAADEIPQHTIYLDAFWIDQHEVTNGQYKQCVSTGTCQPPSQKKSSYRDLYYGISEFDKYPVIYVSRDAANIYCNWAEKRLPTEAEWEKAARGADARLYPWGNNFDQSIVTGYVGGVDTTEVGSYPAGASPYGAFDMAGNAAEWVSDWYDSNYYANSPKENPQGPSAGEYRVSRGGGVNSFNRNFFRTASRVLTSGVGGESSGFRCAA